jgi:hypothetical protein
MTNWTDELTRKQVAAARIALASELRISDHVQARRSEVDGWATVEVFIGRRCHTVSLGPKGGVKFKESAIVE